MRSCGRVSSEPDRAGGELQHGEGMSGILGTTSMAFRFRLSALRVKEGVACAGALGVCRVRMPDFGDRGDDFPRYADPITSVVSGHVVDDESEKRRQRAGPAAG